MHLVHLYLEHRTLKLNQTYTYLAPSTCVKGMRVRVPFGYQSLVGFVVKTESFKSNQVYDYELKEVLEVIDEVPVLNEELLNLGLWMAQETLAPVVTCFQAMLPKLANIRSSVKTIRTERWVIKASEPDKLSPLQQTLWDSFGRESLYTPLKKNFGSSLDSLIKKNYLMIEAREIGYRNQLIKKNPHRLNLSEAQAKALAAIRTATQPICLFGATGSGKTEIYLTLAEEALEAGHQALILVPEIGLTPQMVSRVQARFGQDVIVYHSHLNDTERFLQYKRVREGEKTVVVGTRSAIFLPFHDLSLIVCDEEHDASYKQESHPRYHTKEVALRRAETFQAKVVLGSATPSFETYARALKGVYTLVKLEARVKGELPEITVIAPLRQQRQILAEPTIEAIQARLDLHQQVIILLNRRGYAPILQCLSCAKTIECPACDRLLNVHKDENLLKCHSCGYQTPMIHVCPHCHSNQLRMLGVGTQRLEEEIKKTFPSARILRLDSDSASKKNAHQEILEAFGSHQADILLGTQMIAKGLDIPTVTLSIILEIDQSLLRSDYRSVEEAFDLVVQTAGRSGRSDHIGKVIVQSRLEQHYVHQFAKKHDFDGFFRHEMVYRKAGQNPPYTYLISINSSAPTQDLAAQVLYTLMEDLHSTSIKCLGPSDLGKLQNHYRARLILKGKDLHQMRSLLKEKLEHLSVHSSIDLTIDVNPRSIL